MAEDPGSPDRVFEGERRPSVRLERRFAHPIEKVWRAVTEPEHLSQWFPSPVTVDLSVGGAMTFDFGPQEDGEPLTMNGEVLALDPPRLFEFAWGDEDVLRFELSPDGDGTRLVLTNSFEDRAGGASFAAGWDMCLAALGRVLADEPLPDPNRAVERHEQLVHRFGLDRGVVSEADGRWTVRFERQLTCPADVAWDLFLGVDQLSGEQRVAPAVGEHLTPFAAPDVVLGTVTEVETPTVLAFDTSADEPGDHVRLELRAGTGHGARLVLTVTGTVDTSDDVDRWADERDAVEEQWGTGAVEHVAAEAARWALAGAS